MTSFGHWTGTGHWFFGLKFVITHKESFLSKNLHTFRECFVKNAADPAMTPDKQGSRMQYAEMLISNVSCNSQLRFLFFIDDDSQT
jgi:hypothetical protein